ncbi:MAG: hypothetical protein RRZ42_06315 [Oscillospiraceae bacterium]
MAQKSYAGAIKSGGSQEVKALYPTGRAKGKNVAIKGADLRTKGAEPKARSSGKSSGILSKTAYPGTTGAECKTKGGNKQ